MAEERTLGLALAREPQATEDEPSKDALQRRMEQARDSITNTVSEIKDNVTQQYESVKDALDWREHFKRNPVAWSAGAAGVGLLVGYGLAAAITDREGNEVHYAASPSYRLSQPAYQPGYEERTRIDPRIATARTIIRACIERIRETSAYERLSKEAGSLGDRFIEELSTTAQRLCCPLC